MEIALQLFHRLVEKTAVQRHVLGPAVFGQLVA